MNRNFNIRLISVVTVIALILISCQNEDQKFSKILKNRDVELAYNFKAKYPMSSHNIDSLINVLEYDKVRSSEDIKELMAFVEKFSSSPFIDSVKSRLSRIEWIKINKSPDAKTVSDYMEKYPNSTYNTKAENWLFANSAYGTVIDKRDGKKYQWKKIGDQIWMVQNLNFDINGSSCPCMNENNNPVSDAGRGYNESTI